MAIVKARGSRPRPDGQQPRRPAPPQRGLAARRAAVAVVAAVLEGDATLDEALARHRCDDDALARAIAVATFRRFGTIRAALESRMDKGLPTDIALFALLATGAAQVLVLDVADHAAVDLTVELARSGPRTRHFAGLINAVLRRLARERDHILESASPLGDVPDWLASRWRDIYGPERLTAIAAVHRAGAAIDLTCRSDPEGWAERLGGTLLPTGSVRLADRRAVANLPGYDEGAWWVQDAAASLPARLLGVQPGERVLDLCAAPGGKTAQLVAAGARVTALDRSALRLERLRANMARLRLDAEVLCRDALGYEAEPFDAVLLDAPCTATGTIRRHPDVAWIKGQADLDGLAALQRRLLDRAADLVRPGGRLVYCVCSLEPEEGPHQAASFLDRQPDFARRPVDRVGLGIEPDFITAEGDLRTAPDLWPAGSEGERAGLDGFFALTALRQTR